MDPELIPIGEARERLGVSKPKMAELVKAGLFPVYVNPLDRREKLVRWADVEDALRRPVQIQPRPGDEGKAVAA